MRVNILGATLLAVLAVESFAAHARAESYVVYNGLPCGAFCQSWLGIGPEHNPPRLGSSTAPPKVDSEEPRSAKRQPSTPARFQTIIGALVHGSAPSPAKSNPSEEMDRSSLRTRNAAASHPRKPQDRLTEDVEEHHLRLSVIRRSALRDDQTRKGVSSAATLEFGNGSNARDPLSLQTHALDVDPSRAMAPPDRSAAVVAKTEDQGASGTAPSVARPIQNEQDETVATMEPPKLPGSELNAASNVTPQREALAETIARSKSGEASPADKIAIPAGPAKSAVADGDQRVLILLTNSDIAAPSDLNNRSVVIAGLNSVSQDLVRSTLNAAGCNGVNLSRGSPGDIDQVIVGEASGAIIAVVPSDKADRFSHIAGLKVFKLQLQPH